jgi:charged multivesicular body protein 5
MEQASMTTDNLRNTMATVDAMKAANKEMKKQYGRLDIDKIEVGPNQTAFASRRLRWSCSVCQSIHYDMEDLIEQANEIQESLGRSYSVPEEVDEADLEAGSSSTARYNPLQI